MNVYQIQPLEQSLSDSYWQSRFTTALLTIFAARQPRLRRPSEPYGSIRCAHCAAMDDGESESAAAFAAGCRATIEIPLHS
jgi:hypothetical protein